jgi:hypothetical protein
MDGPTVGLRLPELLILITALWAVISCGQFQTFILTVSNFHTFLLRTDAHILLPQASVGGPSPFGIAICSTGS